MKIVIVSGLSGSGRSTAMNVLEDLGYYCVDNLPISFLPRFIAFCETESSIHQLALAIDIRAMGTIDEFLRSVTKLKKSKNDLDIIFIEANPNVLICRYSESRRPHPFGGNSVQEAIKNELTLLSPIKEIADISIDTSRSNIHEFRKLLQKYIDSSGAAGKININLISFGFKFGLPLESDILLDVRFLPNPYFDDRLKSLTGIDKPVIDFLSPLTETQSFFRKFFPLLNFLLHQYSKEGRSRLTISIGCTGGRHRSVFATEIIKKNLRKRYPLLHIKHRDIEK